VSALWRKSPASGPDPVRTRRRYWISGIAGVVLLSAVMLGFAALGPLRSKSNPSVKTIVLSSEQESAQLVAKGEAALASGDTTAAAAFAAQALILDPANTQAKKLTEAIKQKSTAGTGSPAAGTTPTTGATPTTGTTPTTPVVTTPDGFSGDIADLSLLLPQSFEGYSMGKPAVSGGDVIVSATPKDRSASADRIIWAVHQMQDAAEAQKFTNRVSKVVYGEDYAPVNIRGATGYFGTDGTRFATVSYVRGKYVFEVIATSNSIPPAKLKDTVVRAAQAISDTPPN